MEGRREVIFLVGMEAGAIGAVCKLMIHPHSITSSFFTVLLTQAVAFTNTMRTVSSSGTPSSGRMLRCWDKSKEGQWSW